MSVDGCRSLMCGGYVYEEELVGLDLGCVSACLDLESGRGV